MAKRNIWLAIMRASARQTGLHFTAEEVLRLSQDNAIETLAGNICTDEMWLKAGRDWANVSLDEPEPDPSA